MAPAQDGNAQARFSIGWPLRFESRTTNPADPCYVGRLDKARKPAQHQRPDPKAKWIPPAHYRIHPGTKSWDLWCLLVKRGVPMTGGEIVMRLGWGSKQVPGVAKRLIQANVIKQDKTSRSVCVYSIGSTPVVEV